MSRLSAIQMDPATGLWPWPPAWMHAGQIYEAYTAAQAPWIPTATRRLYPSSLGWRVEGQGFDQRIINRQPDGEYLFLGYRRAGRAADMGPEALCPVLAAQWERIG